MLLIWRGHNYLNTVFLQHENVDPFFEKVAHAQNLCAQQPDFVTKMQRATTCSCKAMSSKIYSKTHCVKTTALRQLFCQALTKDLT